MPDLAYIIDDRQQLLAFDATAKTASLIGTVSVALTDIAVSPEGQMFGITTSGLYRVDPATAAVTLVGSLGVADAQGLTFGSDGTAYLTRGSGAGLYRVDSSTGTASAIGGSYDGADLAFHSGQLMVATSTGLREVNPRDGAIISEIPGAPISGVLSSVDGPSAHPSYRFFGFSGNDAFAVSLTPPTGSGVPTDLGPGVGNIVGATTDGFGQRGSVIRGTSGADVLVGTERVQLGPDGADILFGFDGDDVIDGRSGSDEIWGGAGADTIMYPDLEDFRFRTGFDVIRDFETGVDRIAFTNSMVKNISLSRSGDITTVIASTGDNVSPGALIEVRVHGVVNVGDLVFPGTPSFTFVGDDGGDDMLVGSDFGDKIYGRAGNDTITGGLGVDELWGGAGADVFRYTRAAEAPSGGPLEVIRDFEAGIDKIDLTGVNQTAISLLRSGASTFLFADTPNGPMTIGVDGAVNAADLVYQGTHGIYMLGDAGDNALIGGAAGDTIDGGAGKDAIMGGGGADLIIGGLGADELWGGAGADVFKYVAAADSVPNGYDVIRDFQTGVDRIDLTGVNETSVSLVRSGASTFLFADTPNGPMTIGVDGDVNASDVSLAGTHGVYLLGDAGSNMLIGGANADPISGGAGNDTITGGLGADSLWGGAGADVFKYSSAADSSLNGYDTIWDFETGSDRIDLTGLNETSVSLVRSGQSTFLFAETPNGALTIGVDAAVNAGDIVYQGSHGVYMVGDVGDDVLIGSAFGDPIVGGAGNDVITGGGGGDALFGGAGSDTFRFTAVSDSPSGGPFDFIHDFQSGTDRIDLTALRTGAGDTLGWLGQDGSTIVFAHFATGDMTIILHGTPTITAGDILF